MTEPSDHIPSRNQPCTCGSGKKYKRCCGQGIDRGEATPGSWRGVLIVAAVIAVLAAGTFIVRDGSRRSGPTGVDTFSPTLYDTLDGVNLSRLDDSQREQVLKTANRQRCTCGCRMTLAQCINTDMTCPLRRSNFQRARKLVKDASS